MVSRRRAGASRRAPAVLLLVVGMLLAVGVPTAWALTHRDPALTPIGRGVAVALAESGPIMPTPPESDTLTVVSTAPTPTPAAVPLTGTPAPGASSSSPVRIATGHDPVGAAPSTTGAAPTNVSAAPSTGAEPAKPSSPPPMASTSPSAIAAAPIRPPARLRIPAIGVDARVGPVGLDGRGEMAIPELVQDIGWYEYGPVPGANRGSAVLSGHVDSAQQGLGAFSRLGDLQAGDVITVTDTSGRQLGFRVVGKEAFDKKTVPLADLFSRSGAARLTLITCGGDFDPVARSYLDNIVITAVPR